MTWPAYKERGHIKTKNSTLNTELLRVLWRYDCKYQTSDRLFTLEFHPLLGAFRYILSMKLKLLSSPVGLKKSKRSGGVWYLSARHFKSCRRETLLVLRMFFGILWRLWRHKLIPFNSPWCSVSIKGAMRPVELYVVILLSQKKLTVLMAIVNRISYLKLTAKGFEGL